MTTRPAAGRRPPYRRFLLPLRYALAGMALVSGALIDLALGTPAQAGQIGACPASGSLVTTDGDFNAQNYLQTCEIEITGTFTNLSGGTIDQRSFWDIRVGSDDTFINQGALTGETSIRNGGTVNLEAEGTVQIFGSANQNSAGRLEADAEIINFGTLNIFGDHKTTYYGGFVANHIDNSGTVNVHGSLEFEILRGELLLGGTYDVLADGLMTVSDGKVETDSAQINNAGTLSIGSSSELRIGGSPSLRSSGAANSGTLENAGILTVDDLGTLSNSGGTITSSGEFTVHNFRGSNEDAVFSNQGGTFTNTGTVTVEVLDPDQTFGEVIFDNSAGTFRNDSTASFGAESQFLNAGGTIDNTGSIFVENGVTFAGTGGTLNNTGTFTFDDGTVFSGASGTIDNAGTFTFGENAEFIGTGGTISNSEVLSFGAGSVFSAANSTIGNTGTLTFGDNTDLTVSGGTIDNEGTLTFGAGSSLDLISSDFINSGTLTITADSLVSTGVVTDYLNSGTLTIAASNRFSRLQGDIHNQSGGTFVIHQDFQADLSNELVLDDGGTFDSSGTITVGETRIVNAGDFINRGDFIVENGGFRESAFDNTGVFINRGTVLVEDRGFRETSFRNTGTFINIAGGLIEIEPAGTFASSGTLVNNGVIRAQDFIELGGDVSGAGSYEGSVLMSGSFRPGNSPGLVTAETLSLGAGSTLFVEIGGLGRGTEYDAIDAQIMSLNGILDVALIDLANGFSPLGGETFDLIVADQILGAFSSFSFAALADGLSWATNIVTNQFGQQVFQLIIEGQALAAVPVPGAILLLAIGLLGLAIRQVRKPV